MNSTKTIKKSLVVVITLGLLAVPSIMSTLSNSSVPVINQIGNTVKATSVSNEMNDLINVEKLVKPDCEDELYDYDEEISFNYNDYDYVTYKITVYLDQSLINLSVKDNLPQLDGLVFNNSYVEDDDGDLIPTSKYTFTIREKYLFWNFSYEDIPLNMGTTLTILYCVDIISCDTFENIVNVTGFYYDGGPCCPEWIYRNDSTIVNIICPSGVMMDKKGSVDGVNWVDDEIDTFIGDIIRFKLIIKNLDLDNSVEGVTIEDKLPLFLLLEDVIDRDGALVVSETEPNLKWFFNSLEAGGIREIIFTVRVVDFGSGINLACVYECADSEWCDWVDVDVGEGMFVEKRVSMDDEGPWLENVSVVSSDVVYWNVTIRYFDDPVDPYVLHHIMVNDTTPNGVTFVNGSGLILKSDGWSRTVDPVINGSLLSWDLTDDINYTLLNGSWLSIVFATLVDDGVTGVLENLVNVSAYRCDDSYLFKQDTAIITVEEIINHKPEISNPAPVDHAVNVSVDVTLEIDVDDMDNDLLNVSFYNASDDSVIKIVTSVNPPKTVTASFNDLEYNTTYTWYVKVTDGISIVQSEIFLFTTVIEPENYPPVIELTSVTPSNGAVNVGISPWLAVDISDPDDDALTITFYQIDGSVIGVDTCSGDCTATIRWSNLEYDTMYSWYVIISDGMEDVRGPLTGYWRFTTETIDIDLEINLKGGLGVTLDVINTGADSASDVAWTVDIESSGLFGRIDMIEGDVIPIIGSSVTQSLKVSVFGIGRVMVTGTASCDYAEPEELVKNAFVIGPIVLIY